MLLWILSFFFLFRRIATDLVFFIRSAFNFTSRFECVRMFELNNVFFFPSSRIGCGVQLCRRRRHLRGQQQQELRTRDNKKSKVPTTYLHTNVYSWTYSHPNIYNTLHFISSCIFFFFISRLVYFGGQNCNVCAWESKQKGLAHIHLYVPFG